MSSPAPTASPPPDGVRRERTRSVARRRYKRARWVTAVIGGVAGAAGIALADGGEVGAAAAVPVLLGAAVPWLLVESLWRRARRRHFWDWQ